MNEPLQPVPTPAGLTETDLDLLGSFDHRISDVERGSEICSSSARLHLLVDGWACKYTLLADGRRQITGLHLSGDVCDLDRFFFPTLSFGVRAVSKCRVAEISVDWLKEAVHQRPAVRDLFWSLTVQENIAMTELVTSLGSRSARERVAWFFCNLAERIQRRGRSLDDTFHIEVTQADMADMLGLSVVHINRTLQNLRTDGLISSRGATYAIVDMAQLRRTACFDAGRSI